jgi:hypothetical protein
MKKLIILLPLLLTFSLLSAQFISLDNILSENISSSSGIVPSSSPRFFMFGQTAINATSDLVNTLQGSQKISFSTVLVPQKVKNNKYLNGLDINMSFNLFNLKPNGIARDSFDLTGLMFPDAGNAGFMVGPSWHWRLRTSDKEAHRWSSEASFSLRQNKVNNILPANDSNVVALEDLSFSAININVMPVKYSFIYKPDEDFNFALNIGAYYNFFNIPHEDAGTFNKLFPITEPMFKQDAKSLIHGAGVKVSAGINGCLFFVDIRYHLATKGFNDSNPFKGTIYNFGLAQNLLVFKK